MFEDIPLDTRHYQAKEKPKFPKEWRMTEKRKAELRQIRQKALALDQAKNKSSALINGKEVIDKFLSSKPESEAEPAMARRAGAPLRRGR